MSLGGGVWGRVQGGGGGFPVKNEGKQKKRESKKGVGRVGRLWVGTGKGTACQCACVCQNYPLANYPLVSPQIDQRDLVCCFEWCNLGLAIQRQSSQRAQRVRAARLQNELPPNIWQIDIKIAVNGEIVF